ncbi:MAG: hypothetical protein R3C56_29960 [Pirellulaceae bacterium]
MSQPLVEYCVRKSDPTDGLLQSFMVEVTLFKAQTLATDADDFRNFETLSMVMLDLNYDGDVFRLSEVHWGEEIGQGSWRNRRSEDAGDFNSRRQLCWRSC